MTVLILQPAQIDSPIVDFLPSTNQGSATYLEVGGSQIDSSTWRSLLKFDLSSLPSDAIISSAVLSIYATTDASTNTRTFRVYRLKRAWVENQVTWSQYSSGNNWQTAGADGSNDRESTDIGSRSFTAGETLNQFKDFNLTPTTKAALDLGNGWLIRADTESSDAYSFASSNDATAVNRPLLTITYTVPSASDLSINTSQAVSVNSSTVALTMSASPTVSKSESILVNESVTLRLAFLTVTVSDLVTMTEAYYASGDTSQPLLATPISVVATRVPPRTIGSKYRSLGFTVNYYESLIQGGRYLGAYADVTSWGHVIQAFGGFDTATFTRQMAVPEMQDWLEDGLGRIIRVYGSSLQPIWEGFVDKVTLTFAGYEVSRGPLTDIANRVELVYSTFDIGFEPPIPGIRNKTGVTAALDSRDKYGVFDRILSVAGATVSNATQLRDTYLDEHSDPEITSNFSLSSSGPSIRIDCKGYKHLLMYPYNRLSSGFVTISNKIIEILSADVNAFVTDFTEITPNSHQVIRWENDDVKALDLIKGLVAMGDDSSVRYLFGIYEDRKAVYGPVPLTVDYKTKLSDPQRKILDNQGNEIPLEQVRPGHWIMFEDFLPGYSAASSDLRLDPRLLFIESVSYSIPNGLTLNGGKVSRLEQKLARFGLSGLSS